jgi:hypothetical protein
MAFLIFAVMAFLLIRSRTSTRAKSCWRAEVRHGLTKMCGADFNVCGLRAEKIDGNGKARAASMFVPDGHA